MWLNSTCTIFMHALDVCVRACHTDEVKIDEVSLWLSSVVRVRNDTWVERWCKSLCYCCDTPHLSVSPMCPEPFLNDCCFNAIKQLDLKFQRKLLCSWIVWKVLFRSSGDFFYFYIFPTGLKHQSFFFCIWTNFTLHIKWVAFRFLVMMTLVKVHDW